jgi:hypothetical protein
MNSLVTNVCIGSNTDARFQLDNTLWVSPQVSSLLAMGMHWLFRTGAGLIQPDEGLLQNFQCQDGTPIPHGGYRLPLPIQIWMAREKQEGDPRQAKRGRRGVTYIEQLASAFWHGDDDGSFEGTGVRR